MTWPTTSTPFSWHSGSPASARVDAVGWSMGAGVLQQLVLAHPEDDAANVDEDFLTDELVLTRTGEDF